MDLSKMSTKIEDNNKNQSVAKNDWDDDENWDDWGDAEDSGFPEIVNQEKEENVIKQPSNNNVNNNIIKKLNEATPKINTKQATSTATPPSTPNDSHQTTNKSSWGSLWGAVVSTASGVTSTVSQGINQVIGVPDPEEMARINKEQESKIKLQKENTLKEKSDNENNMDAESTLLPPVFHLSGVVSGVTTIGSKVLNTGLDTLEGIGKKTMDILQENDPLLMNKRKLLRLETEKPNLSEILKEAKQESEQLEHAMKELKISKCKQQQRFELLFERYCGVVHLEALEILSKESSIKLRSLLSSVTGNALTDLEETVNEVKELLELEDVEAENSEEDYEGADLQEKLIAAIEDSKLPIKFDEIVKNWQESLDWLKSISELNETPDEQEIFTKAITTLAESCALAMGKLHKIAELLLVKEHHSTANEVDSIVQLCKHFNWHLNGLTNRYASTLSSTQNDETKEFVTILFSELVVATQQIETAFHLFLPILQMGAV